MLAKSIRYCKKSHSECGVEDLQFCRNIFPFEMSKCDLIFSGCEYEVK